MFFSHIERDLKKSFMWAQFLFIFPYKCDRRVLVLDKFLACGYGFMVFLAVAFPTLNVYILVKDGVGDIVKYSQLVIFTGSVWSIVLIPVLQSSNLKSVVDDLIGMERDLCRLGLSAEPKRSTRFSIMAALSIAAAATYELAVAKEDESILGMIRRTGNYLRLSVIVAEGHLTMGFILVAGHVFTLLNASSLGPTQITAYKIDALTDLHSRTVDVCRRMNDIFSSYLALLFLSTLSTVTTSSYGILQQLKKYVFVRVPIDLFWMLALFTLTTRLIYVFSEIEKEAAKFRNTLCHHLEKGVDTNSMAFLNYKLTVDRLTFTAKGFVDIHPSILLTILSCAVTYLIILID